MRKEARHAYLRDGWIDLGTGVLIPMRGGESFISALDRFIAEGIESLERDAVELPLWMQKQMVDFEAAIHEAIKQSAPKPTAPATP